MNCEKLTSITRWHCTPSGIASVRAVSPISLGEGGQHIAFFIAQPTPDSFYLTDACETAIHAEQMGISLTKARLDSLNRTPGIELAEFAIDWSIEASGPLSGLPLALWDAVKLALALSFKSRAWQPKYAQAKFQAIVLQELEAQLGTEKIMRQVRIQGSSGHMIDFPMGIKRDNGGLIYVQPVALDNGKINWPSIYEFHGKLFDVKAASDIDNRLAVIESGASAIEYGRASSFLGQAAPVITIDDIPSLSKMISAR